MGRNYLEHTSFQCCDLKESFEGCTETTDGNMEQSSQVYCGEEGTGERPDGMCGAFSR